MKGDTFTFFFSQNYQLGNRFLVIMQGIGFSRWLKTTQAGYSLK